MPNKDDLPAIAIFELIGQIPGKMLFERVKAQSNEQIREAGNIVVVNAGGDSLK